LKEVRNLKSTESRRPTVPNIDSTLRKSETCVGAADLFATLVTVA